MRSELDHECNERLGRTHLEILKLLREQEDFVNKMFTIHKYHYNHLGNCFVTWELNYRALHDMLSASLRELELSFDVCLDTFLDISDLEHLNGKRSEP